MSPVLTSGGSVRAQRLRALAPRLLVYATLAVLSLTGLRSLLAPAPAPVIAPPPAADREDPGLTSFAEGFARAYLTWDADAPEAHAAALAPFLGEADDDGGLTPAPGTTQAVAWTSVSAVEQRGRRTLVTVAAQTSQGMAYLVVPVARNEQGALVVADYPALVGPPAVDREGALEASVDETGVEDQSLVVVIERALRNYLARSQDDLLADLAPGAAVSPPSRELRLDAVDAVTWVTPNRRVGALLRARDRHGTELTLRYELDVRLSDRWYVRAIHVDPTGGTR